MLNIDYGKVADELITDYVGNTGISEETEKVIDELDKKGKYAAIHNFLIDYQEKFDEIEDWDGEAIDWDDEQTDKLAKIIENLMK